MGDREEEREEDEKQADSGHVNKYEILNIVFIYFNLYLIQLLICPYYAIPLSLYLLYVPVFIYVFIIDRYR